jgi:predicted DNA-binding transcriptional regulator AlpA
LENYIKSLPEVITIAEVQKILRIGRSQAYEIARQKNFPRLPIDKPIRVPKNEFLKWARITENQILQDKL